MINLLTDESTIYSHIGIDKNREKYEECMAKKEREKSHPHMYNYLLSRTDNKKV
jgi:hypothetical protein